MISLESCAFFALSFIIPLVYGDDEKLCKLNMYKILNCGLDDPLKFNNLR
jgi:hypothetical protein